MRRTASSLIIALLFLSLIAFIFTVQSAKAATGIITINPDGSISSPVTANITTTDMVTYTFNGSNYLPIVVNKSSIIINGMGYSLQASGQNGFSLTGVSHVTIENTIISNSQTGIYLESSHNCTVSGNDITNNSGDGVFLYGSNNCTIIGNEIRASIDPGIYMEGSSSNTISGNTIKDTLNEHIELLYSSNNNIISENRLTNSTADVGIYAYACSLNSFFGNNITDNANSGIRLDLSSGTTISENNISENLNGVYLWYCSNITISGNGVTANEASGIILDNSGNSIVKGNNITANNGWGINPAHSSNNTISGNNIRNNNVGINSASSDFNVISANNIVDNVYSGIYLESSSNNTFYHNNLINNTNQADVDEPGYPNYWDDGYPSGGNYWSDYRTRYPSAVENDSSAIWNTPYAIDANNTDRYPLMGSFYTFSVGTWNSVVYSVDMVSNSTVTNLSFNATAKTLTFNVTGASGTMGFCRVVIPTGLMWAENPPAGWLITVGGVLYGNQTITTLGDYTCIYFTYTHSAKTIQIQSTHAVPEFQLLFLMPLSVAMTLLSVLLKIRRKGKDRT